MIVLHHKVLFLLYTVMIFYLLKMISILTIETHYVSNKLNKKFVTSSNIELSTAGYSREILTQMLTLKN